MKWGRFLLILAGAIVLQRAVTPAIEIGGIGPDLPLLLVLHLSLAGQPGSIFFAQWLAGAIRDVYGGGVFGLSAVTFPIVGWIVARLGADLYARHPFTQVGLTFLAGLQVELVFSVVLFLRASHLDLFALFLHGLGTALYTGLAAIVVFRLFEIWPVILRDDS